MTHSLVKSWKEVDGYLPDNEAEVLIKLAEGKDCLEIGSFKGKSTTAMASTAKSVLAIDTFRSNVEINPHYQVPQKFEGHTTLEDFIQNTKGYNNIEYIVGRSCQVLRKLARQQFDLIFIDGFHNYNQVAREISLSWDLIKEDGVFVFHDANLGGIVQAIFEVFDETKTTFVGTLAWVFKKEGKLLKTNYKRYLEDMFFFVKPMDAVPKYYNLQFDSDILPLGETSDICNVILPFDNDLMKEKLADICTIPKMSTFAIGSLINLAVSELLDYECFVNVGVWHGFTFLCGVAGNPSKKCIGVDNFSEFTANEPKERFYEKFDEIKSENHTFYEGDCFEYLENHHAGLIGLYMYDGQHTEESQLKGLQLAEPFFSDNCLILIDDLNQGHPVIESLATFMAESKYEYRVLFEQLTSQNGHPSFWAGITLLQKGFRKGVQSNEEN